MYSKNRLYTNAWNSQPVRHRWLLVPSLSSDKSKLIANLRQSFQTGVFMNVSLHPILPEKYWLLVVGEEGRGLISIRLEQLIARYTHTHTHTHSIYIDICIKVGACVCV